MAKHLIAACVIRSWLQLIISNPLQFTGLNACSWKLRPEIHSGARGGEFWAVLYSKLKQTKQLTNNKTTPKPYSVKIRLIVSRYSGGALKPNEF